MADIPITAASVARVSGTVNKDFLAGETITPGMPVYLSAANAWLMMKHNGTNLEAGYGATQYGFALHGSLVGQPLAVQTDGTINLGATLTVGTLYMPGAAYGGVAPWTDLSAAEKITILGIAATAANLNMAPKYASGLAVPA